MTIASAVSKVTLNGNGSTTSFPFGFKVWKAADLEVSITDASGVVSVVTNWGVALNPSGGGTVAYPTSGPPLPPGHKITIARSMDFLQDVDLVSGTRWDPEVVETALDRATAERQQLKERLDRAVAVPISSSTTPEQFADDLFTARDGALASASAAAASAAAAQAAANSVGVLSASGTLTDGQDTITLPWSYDTSTGNIAVFLGGVKQLRSTLTFLTSTTVQIGAAVTENTPYEVTSVTLAAESALTGIRDQCVTAKTGAETARTGAEAAKAEAEAARAGAEAAKAGAEAARDEAASRILPIPVAEAAGKAVVVSVGGGYGLEGVKPFPAGTRLLFQQSTAPTGWTKDTTVNDKALRVVSGAVGSGGDTGFSSIFSRTMVDSTTLVTSQMPSHGHSLRVESNSVDSSAPYTQPYLAATNSSLRTATHASNPATASGSVQANGGNGSHTHGLDLRLAYIDVIIATKD